jgi:ABC-type arginine transport system ATPase subunit
MKITSEAVQRYARIALYWLAGMLVQHGIGNQSMVEPAVGFGVTAITFLWTIYGNRIVAKLNEIAKMDIVQNVVVTDQAVADATADKVVSTAEVHVAAK